MFAISGSICSTAADSSEPLPSPSSRRIWAFQVAWHVLLYWLLVIPIIEYLRLLVTVCVLLSCSCAILFIALDHQSSMRCRCNCLVWSVLKHNLKHFLKVSSLQMWPSPAPSQRCWRFLFRSVRKACDQAATRSRCEAHTRLYPWGAKRLEHL